MLSHELENKVRKLSTALPGFVQDQIRKSKIDLLNEIIPRVKELESIANINSDTINIKKLMDENEKLKEKISKIKNMVNI